MGGLGHTVEATGESLRSGTGMAWGFDKKRNRQVLRWNQKRKDDSATDWLEN